MAAHSKEKSEEVNDGFSIIIILSVLLLIPIALLMYVGLSGVDDDSKDSTSSINQEATETPLTGTISKITYRPNQVEDGYYMVEVKVDNKVAYLDFNSFLNTPVLPEAEGLKCLPRPAPESLEEGDKLEFFLPKVSNEAKKSELHFDLCFPLKDTTHYYLKNLS